MALCVSVGSPPPMHSANTSATRNSAEYRLPPDQYPLGVTFLQAIEDQNTQVGRVPSERLVRLAPLSRRHPSEPHRLLSCKSGDHHIRSKTGVMCTLRRTEHDGFKRTPDERVV